MSESPFVYLDHAATTPVRPEVAEVMWPLLATNFGNPASLYGLARDARQTLEAARTEAADVLGCRAAEVLFTSGGTESANLALRGILESPRASGRHLVVSSVEHVAVLETARALERRGFALTTLPVDGHGKVRLDALAEAVRPDTALVSLMLANNEVGTLQPVAEASRLVKSRNPAALVHTDAAIATRHVYLDVEPLGVDLLSLSAHKCDGPKGAGLLYVRRGLNFAPQIVGGPHERGRRAGTENVAGAVGLARALRLAQSEVESNRARDGAAAAALRDAILTGVPGAALVGHPTERLPNNAAFCLPRLDGEMVIHALDRAGVAASSGSACASASLDPSHVLMAMGLPPNLAHGSLRLTTGRLNSVEQSQAAAATVVSTLNRLLDLVHPRR